MTSPIARLRRGADIIYFEQGTAYQLSDDFTPPGSSMAASFSGGTSANIYGGAVKIGEKGENREVSFSVYCVASTKDNAAPQSLANRLVTMVSGAGDEVAPLWFEWTITPGLPEPIWGQFGAWRRAEVVHGSARYATRIGQYSRQEMVEVVVTLTIEPFALGTRQEVYYGDATTIDRFGNASFTPTGLLTAEDTTNLIPNPVFGNRTAWNTNWTAANLSAYENIDLNYVYPGVERSALLICSATAGTYTTPITVSSTASITQYFSAYIKKPDSSAVTSSDCEVYAGAALTSTYTLLGNGVYRAVASAAPATSADWPVGVSLSPGRSIYLLGYQAEEKTHFTPLAWGDQPGVTWATSAHDSASLRAFSNPGSYITDYDVSANGSAAIFWIPEYPSTESGNRVLLDLNGVIQYTEADDKFNVTIGSITVSSPAQTFAAGDQLRIYATWGITGIDLYINGVNVGTSATFIPDTSPSLVMRIGINNIGVSISGGLYRAVEIYDQKLTQTQITAIDSAFLSLGTKENIDTIPISGSRSLTQTATFSWAQHVLIDAIPGTASPLIDLENTTYTNFPTDTETRISTLAGTQYMAVGSDGLFVNCSTAAIAVSASADEVLSTSTIYRINELMGETVWIATRLTDAGANLQLDYKLAIGGTEVRIGYKSFTADATQRVFFLGPLYIPSRSAFPERIVRNKNLTATGTLYAQRTTGGASNVEIDYVNIMLPNLVILKRTGAGSVAGTPYINYYDGEGANLYDDAAVEEYLQIIGGKLKLDPMRMNWINWQPGANGSANASTQTLSFRMIITPRWAL